MEMSEIRMDMIESGNTIMKCKMQGWVPATHEPDDFNLYVRTVGSTVIVTRSDDDSTIVSAVGFTKAMTALANHYGLPVVVSHELDHGYAPSAKSQELAGTYEPTITTDRFVKSSDGVEVRVGDVLDQTDTNGVVHVMRVESITSRGIVTLDLDDRARRNLFEFNTFRALISPALSSGVAPIVKHVDRRACHVTMPFRTASKHKSTSKSRARRGGAR